MGFTEVINKAMTSYMDILTEKEITAYRTFAIFFARHLEIKADEGRISNATAGEIFVRYHKTLFAQVKHQTVPMGYIERFVEQQIKLVNKPKVIEIPSGQRQALPARQSASGKPQPSAWADIKSGFMDGFHTSMSLAYYNDPCPCGSGKKYGKCCFRSNF